MAIRIDVKRSKIFNEGDELFKETYFSYTRDKFINHIDTLYYSVSILNDYNSNPNVLPLIDDFNCYKGMYLKEHKPIEMDKDNNLFFISGKFDDIYNYRINCPDKFDIFISSYLPNSATPRIIVQLRSSFLWLTGIDGAIEESFLKVHLLLKKYNLSVGKVYENRIDYCYHTNYCKDMYKFFNDNYINNSMKTNLKTWRKDGHVYTGDLDLNYFALGNRTSNNVFVRIYDKTREVVEMAYKAFFIQIWFENGLISAYDKFVLEFCYKYHSYEKKYEGMLNFYLKYGSDDNLKNHISLLLNSEQCQFDDIKKLALMICPDITTICNIEFQTKRKFYYYADKQIESLDTFHNQYFLSRIFKIVDNRKIFLNYLTSTTLKFVNSSGEYDHWWAKLRSSKIKSLNIDGDLIRDYQNKLDTSKIIKSVVRSIATLSVYADKKDNNFVDDVSDFFATLNDNDVKRFNFNVLNADTGEIINNFDSTKLIGYDIYKQRKYKMMKNRITDLSKWKEKKEPVSYKLKLAQDYWTP